jgi:hypothetical protein
MVMNHVLNEEQRKKYRHCFKKKSPTSKYSNFLPAGPQALKIHFSTLPGHNGSNCCIEEGQRKFKKKSIFFLKLNFFFLIKKKFEKCLKK